MGAHRKTPACSPLVQECRESIDSLRLQVIKSRALRETASDLRQYNAELRELLLETRLGLLSREERWMNAGQPKYNLPVAPFRSQSPDSDLLRRSDKAGNTARNERQKSTLLKEVARTRGAEVSHLIERSSALLERSHKAIEQCKAMTSIGGRFER